MNARDGAGTVVVGVDGSPESRAALAYAMDDAARRGARLRVVAALARPDYWVTAYGPVPLPPSSEEVERVGSAARQWIDHLTADRPHDAVPIEVSAVPGPAAEALITASRDADLLVLGHRGRGAVAGMLLGSVGMRCVVEAPCTVTVVPPAPVATVAAVGPHHIRPTRPTQHRTRVSEVMTTKVLSVPPEATFAQIADVLSTGRVRAVPVLDDAGALWERCRRPTCSSPPSGRSHRRNGRGGVRVRGTPPGPGRAGDPVRRRQPN